MKPVAIYARVSSERQKEQETIASQTALLLEHAASQNWTVPAEWQFLDEGYSGASLVRPNLDRLRDRVAEGQVDTVLVLSPDRLSRKYAYQILLSEEFHRHGAELVFMKSPPATTPEQQLLTQVQGMIAEYERTQIIERTRRGKRHRARQGLVNVLSTAPYGYRYVRKSDSGSAFFEVLESQGAVVRRIFEMYTVHQAGLGEIVRKLNQEAIATRTGKAKWNRSTIWAILRNTAYIGKAGYGKTECQPHSRINRRSRQQGGYSSRPSHKPRPREEWIEIGVPAIVDEATFYLAQERVAVNKQLSSRRTITPSLLQSLLVCEYCGYNLYRNSSVGTQQKKRYYYRCPGRDAWRHLKQTGCHCPLFRQDDLDDVVWQEVIRLLEDPALLQTEITRRVESAKQADPVQRRAQDLRQEQARLEKSIERLMTAYQEDLLNLDELRERVGPIRRRKNTTQVELKALETAAADQQRYLHLVESLAPFQARLRARAEMMDIEERQKIVRLLVKEVIVSADTITIRHCLPMSPRPSSGPNAPMSPDISSNESSLLCTRRLCGLA
jgi:site-specific DNA recombinase